MIFADVKLALNSLIHDGLRFAVVGAGGYLLDVVIFNAILWGNAESQELIHDPIVAKVMSASFATFGTWLGNRYWTFRSRRRAARMRELAEFALVAIGGIGISVTCLWFSHYVLGFTSLLADNIATNGVGFVLATLFRFMMYRHWVFGRHRSDMVASENAVATAAAASLSMENGPGGSEIQVHSHGSKRMSR